MRDFFPSACLCLCSKNLRIKRCVDLRIVLIDFNIIAYFKVSRKDFIDFSAHFVFLAPKCRGPPIT